MHLHATKQRLLRLHVLTAWGQKANAMVQVSRVLEATQHHTQALRDAADQISFLHVDLQNLQVRRLAGTWPARCSAAISAGAIKP